MSRPIGLTDEQLDNIQRAAEPLHPSRSRRKHLWREGREARRAA